MSVSIIIPNYNNAEHLSACLDSCLQQGAAIQEVVVVDDHSTDNSWGIIQDYTQKNPQRIRAFYNPRNGAAAARNYGFEQSNGQWIQFLDADDLLGPGKVKAQLNALERIEKAAIASCSWQHFFAQPGDGNDSRWQTVDQSYDHTIDWLLNGWMGQGMGQTGVWLTPRHLIEQAGPWDESLTQNQDGEFFCRVLLRASRIEFVRDALVYYRKPEAGNVSQNQSFEAANSLLRSYQSYQREILNVEDSPRVRKALALNYLNFIYRIYPRFPNLQQLAWEAVEVLGEPYSQQIVGGKYFRYLARIFGLKGALKIKGLLSPTSVHA